MELKTFSQGQLKFISCETDSRSKRDELYIKVLAPYIEELDKLVGGTKHAVNTLSRRHLLFKFLQMKAVRVPVDVVVGGEGLFEAKTEPEYTETVSKGLNTEFYFETLKEVWNHKCFNPFADSCIKPSSTDTFVIRMSTSSPGAYALTFYNEEEPGTTLHQRYQAVSKGCFYLSDENGILVKEDKYRNMTQIITEFEMNHFNKTKKMLEPERYG